MVELGLNSHHQAVLLSYMKFARYLREQSIKTVEDDFKNANAALFDNTYTQDEVRKILENLQTLVTCDVEAEMGSFAHNNVLMLQQLFTQAEKWHLRMEIQLSELQNRDLLEMIQLLEADESIIKPPVEKNNEENSIALLRMEIERLRNENQMWQDQQQQCADKLERTQEELAAVTEKLKLAGTQIQAYRNLSAQPAATAPGNDKMVTEMAEKLLQVEEVLHMDQESSRQRQNLLQTELNSTREQVIRVQAQLQLAELELERKFSETKAYANMKQILIKKNTQMKRMRARLQELGDHDNSGSGGEGDEDS